MQKIEQLFNQLQELQPLKAEDKKRLDDKFTLEFNYNSNYIEGNTLTYGQTKLLLVFGEATGDAKMRDLEEMKAHNVGLKWIRGRAKDKEYILTERDIRDLNRIILAEDYYKLNTQTGTRYKINVGVYKTRPNSVITATGETFDYALPEEIPALMYELIKWFNDEEAKAELTPIELASLLHYRYIRIHPFEDGNGRIARLLVTYVLERFGYPMVIIKSENKEEYLRVLHQCDVNVGLTPSDGASASIDDIAPFVAYMKRQLEWSLDISIKAAMGESIEENEDWNKVLKMSHSGRISAPERDKEYEDKFVAEYLIPFFKYINEQLKEYFSLFSEVKWRCKIHNSNTTRWSDFHFNAEVLDILKNNNPHIVVFTWTLEQYAYVISIDINGSEKIHIENRYDQPPTVDEKNEVVNSIGKLFTRILAIK